MVKLFQRWVVILKAIYRRIRYFYWLFQAKHKGELPPVTVVQPKILFLLPEAGIGLYIKTFVTLASQFKLQGYQVYFARCFNLFERCMFMDSESLSLDATPEQKKLLCTYCFRSFDKNVVKNNFDYIDLRHFSKEEDGQEIQAVIDKNPDGIFNFDYEGIRFSGILKYNYYLFLKKSDFSELTPAELALWQQHLRSLFTGYRAAKRALEHYQISHVIMCDEYSLNRVMKDLARKMNISLANVTFPYHKDIDTTQIKVLHEESFSQSSEAIARWPDFTDICLTPLQLRDAVDDLIIRMSQRGIYAYSPSKSAAPDLLKTLGLQKSRKTIVAYPSSPDEVDAIIHSREAMGLPMPALEDAFSNQFEWLDDLIAYIEQSEQFQLIIRLHPRLAPNHREKWGCSAAQTFHDRYAKNYRHVKVIWPHEKFSSFDLGEIADVVTVAWSSMGGFMARLGIPVVSGLKLSLPIPNEPFHVFCQTKPDYFAAIERLAYEPTSMLRLKHAYRWYHMIALGYCVDLEDVLEGEAPKLDVLSQNAEVLKEALIENRNVLEMNRQFWKKSQVLQSDNLESQELEGQLLRLIHYFITNQDSFNMEKRGIVVSFAEDEIAFTNAGNNLCIRGAVAAYHYEGDKYEKYSPLVARLAAIVQEIRLSRQVKKTESDLPREALVNG